MEVAFFVVAIIGLLALSASQGGSLSGNIGGGQTQVTYTGPPQTWSPSPAPAYQPPMVPSQTANIDGKLITGGAQIGTQVAQQSVAASGVSGVGLTAATAGIAAGIGIIAGIATSLLQAHEARLRGATNENQAVDQYVPVFDSFVHAIVNAWNSGQATAAEVAQACQQFDRYLYNTFRSFVGQPGTAWSDSIGMSGQCNSGCTVGCCVYFGDLGPVLNNISYVLGYPTGKWGQGDPRISGRTVTVPKVYSSKYSSYTRPLYTVTLK